MKNAVFLYLAVFITGFLTLSCENESQTISGKIISSTDCKTFKSDGFANGTPDSLSCINYYYDKSGQKLMIKHINAGFNCCQGELYCTVYTKNDTIIIQEFEKSALCDCDCLYDLEIEVTGVTSKQYQIKFIEPYCGDQEKIMFKADLARNNEGSFCVIRKHYPWGMGF